MAPGADRLGPWLAEPGSAGIFTDFDGTLAPIVDDPSAAVALTGATHVLGALARRYASVTVVSGRPVAYLAEHLVGIEGLVLVGLYGLERVVDGTVVHPPGAEGWREQIETVAAAADRESPAGVGVERKGLALTLHVRRAPELAGWIRDFARDHSAGSGLVAHPGRMSVELRPAVDTDKGTVVEELADGLGAVAYFGDDTGDLPAVAALGRMRDRGVATLSVAARSAESPPELLEAVDLVVDGPDGVLAVMRRLAAG